jgi:hypothetical protein
MDYRKFGDTVYIRMDRGDKHCVSAGHIKSITVLYTAEIELRPDKGGMINRKFNPETGTGFWDFR